MIRHSQPSLGNEEIKACAQVLKSLQIGQGPKVEEFEERFAFLSQRKYGIAVNSGSMALEMSLVALGIGHGDKVVVPSYMCAALLHAIDRVGGVPVVVDVSTVDLNISAEEVRKAFKKKPKVVIVPHVFGRAANMAEISKLGIPVIEDGTQALGAKVNDKPVGSFGDVSLFSFYATKMMTTGEGGVLLTDSKRIAQRLRDFRDYDKKKNYAIRFNAKMSDLQAAIGIVQLKKLRQFVKARRSIASIYNKSLSELGALLPASTKERDHVYFRYVIRSRYAKKMIFQLDKKNIEAKSPIFKPLHQYLKLSDKKFPITMKAMKETCSLPIYPSLSAVDAKHVVQNIKSILS